MDRKQSTPTRNEAVATTILRCLTRKAKKDRKKKKAIEKGRLWFAHALSKDKIGKRGT